MCIRDRCVDNIMQIWRDGKADKLTQLVFCDISTPQAKAPAKMCIRDRYHGGNGLGSVSAWYAEDGIHLSHGKSVRYDRSAQVISWESAAERIGELLESGQFASNVELAEAAGYERSLLEMCIRDRAGTTPFTMPRP